MITLLGRRQGNRHHLTLTAASGLLRTDTAQTIPRTADAAASTASHHLVRHHYYAAHVVPATHKYCLRSIHATPSSSLSNNAGFGALLNRNNDNDRSNHERGSKQSATTKDGNNFQEASSTLVNSRDESSGEDWLDDNEYDDNNGMGENINNSATSEYDFGNQDSESELQEWHKQTEEKFHQLVSKTTSTLQSASTENEFILSLMKEWDAFLSNFTSELYSMSDFRRMNQQYPPSIFMTSLTNDAAENAESLLVFILGGGGADSASLTPEMEVNAYKLAMSAWSKAFHPQSGDRCTNILEQYGERYGGDMSYMPTVDSYKAVQEAHLKSSSSYDAQSSEGEPSPGKKALEVLTLLTNVSAHGDMFLKPDVELYSLTISVIRNTLFDWQSRRRFYENRSLEQDLAERLLDSLERLESSLEEMAKSEKKDGGNKLSLQQWHCAIRAYADGLAVASSIPPIDSDDEKITDTLLVKLEHLLATNSSNILHSIADDELNDTGVKRLLDEMQRNVEESYTSALSSGLLLSKKDGSFPDFNSVVANATSTEEIFQRMRRLSQESPPDSTFLFPPPTSEHYQAVVKAWCECVRKQYSNPESNDAMKTLEELPHLRAQRFLEELETQQAGQPFDGSIYVDAVWAWGQILNWPSIYRQNSLFFAANSIEALLHRTMSLYDNGSISFSAYGDITKMYNFALRLHSKTFKGGEKAMKRSLNLLDQMELWYTRSEGVIAQPDAFTFGLILKTISNSGVESSASIAGSVLQKMESFGVKPREKHYLGLMRAYSRIGDVDVSDPTKAEAVLQHVKEKYNVDKSVKPTAAIYSACISAYGGSKKHNSVSKVMELFEELKGLYKETNDDAFRPDSELFSALIGAISKAQSKGDTSIRQAIHMLDVMEASYDAGEITEGPDRYAYTNLLHAISQSKVGDGGSLAEDLMQRLDRRSRELKNETLTPDTHAYTTLIQIFSRSKDPDSVQRAQKWFQKMKKQHEDGDSRSKPNKVTCTALINCWRHSYRDEAGEEAERILSMMESKYEDGDLDLKPDAFVYASALDTWARSKSHDKAVRAWNLYQRMKTQYSNGNMESKPNNVIMSSIIKACGFTRGSREDKQKALKVLLECMADLKSTKYFIPTPLLYRTSLNAVKALVVDDSKRRPISATIFETCCRNGQLDGTVLEALENAQPDLYAKLPGEIPSKWKTNVAKVKTYSR